MGNARSKKTVKYTTPSCRKSRNGTSGASGESGNKEFPSDVMADIHENRLKSSDKYNIHQKIQKKQELERRIQQADRKQRQYDQTIKDWTT